MTASPTSSFLQTCLDGIGWLAETFGAAVREEVGKLRLEQPERLAAFIESFDNDHARRGRALVRLRKRQADRALRRGQLDQLLKQMDATPLRYAARRTGLQDLKSEGLVTEIQERWWSRAADEPAPLTETALDLRPAVQAIAP